MNLILRIEKFPKYMLFLFSLVIVFSFGFLDYLTGTDFSFYIFYVIPVLFIVWFAGKEYGFLLCLICLIPWFIDAFFLRDIEIKYSSLVWNIFVEFSFFVILIFSVSALKKAVRKQQEAEKQKITRELEIAKEVQQKLFPQTKPEVNRLDYSGFCKPAEAVGGDYYDYFRINKFETAFAIGDIAGHGLPSALLMAGLVGFVRSNAVVFNEDLSAFMDKVNKLMCESTDGSKFATFFYSVYNSETGILRFVNAGHNPPLLLKAKTNSFEELKTDGFLIGAVSNFDYKVSSVKLDKGDLLVCYTDGITESFNPKDEQFGTERLKNTLEKNRTLNTKDLCEKIICDVKMFSDGREQADDMTLLALKIF